VGLRRTATRRSDMTYMKSVIVGRSSSSTDKGPFAVRAFSGASPYWLETDETSACSAHELRMDGDGTSTSAPGTRPSPSATGLETGRAAKADLDHNAVGTRVSNLGDGGAPRLDYVVVEYDFPGRNRAITGSRRPGWHANASEAGRGTAADRNRPPGGRGGRPDPGSGYTPRHSIHFLGHSDLHVVPARRLRHHVRGHPHSGHLAPRLTQRTSSFTGPVRISSRWLPVGSDGKFTITGQRLRRACTSSTANQNIMDDLR